ncbi:hypothetical protein QC764_406150 [Podospora pseudoanserina]|uniref:EngB-type G domain-containing protein n=1 Tax=Podospora pseudoanserina TaxID=2609844 RepID=A0ABR0IB41_9PEZI|nr:hypothetical protein QC764_406150 [Podospora pseudoanserina]
MESCWRGARKIPQLGGEVLTYPQPLSDQQPKISTSGRQSSCFWKRLTLKSHPALRRQRPTAALSTTTPSPPNQSPPWRPSAQPPTSSPCPPRSLLLTHHILLPTRTFATRPGPRRHSIPPLPGFDPEPPLSQTTEEYIPPLESTSYLPPPSNDPNGLPFPAPPSKSSLAKATGIFTSKGGPKFLYSAGRFLELPVNTHTPEICLIGRSNVGKSTLINALSGLLGASARNSHGVVARKQGSAITSRKAGCTVTLNGYGFGTPPPEPPSALEEIKAKREAVVKGATRQARREAQKEYMQREKPRRYALIMVDMPGYGLGSKKDWGVEIQKYLAKRQMLKGAVVLIDAETGVKEQDRMVLGNLRDHDVRTVVVLTKGDKVVDAAVVEQRKQNGEGKGGAEERIGEVLVGVWKELRRAERRSLTWLEGGDKGWEREVWVTGAGDPRNGGLGVETARWAICRLAGLVEDKRKIVVPGLDIVVGKGKKEVVEVEQEEPEIVSFDDIEALMEREKARPKKRLHPSF